jgi:hypothetical protein
MNAYLPENASAVAWVAGILAATLMLGLAITRIRPAGWARAAAEQRRSVSAWWRWSSCCCGA